MTQGRSGQQIVSLEEAVRLLTACPGTVAAAGLDLARMPEPEKHAGLLTSEEASRAARYANPQDAEWFRRRRIAVRLLLSDLFRLPLASFDLMTASNGQVSLRSYDTSLLPHGRLPRFSFAARRNVLVAAFSLEREVGCDVELDNACFADRHFAVSILSERELALIDALPAVQQPRAVHTAWVAKEALLKRMGCGLMREPKSVELLETWDPAAQRWTCREPMVFFEDEYLSLLFGPGIAAAVAPGSAEAQVICVQHA